MGSLLVIGICLAAASASAPATRSRQTEARECLNSDLSPPDNEGKPTTLVSGGEAPEDVASTTAGRIVTGYMCAVICGLFNGSLMVPVTCFQNGSELLGVVKYSGTGIAPIAFLPSLAIGILIVQPVFFLLYFAPSLLRGQMP